MIERVDGGLTGTNLTAFPQRAVVGKVDVYVKAYRWRFSTLAVALLFALTFAPGRAAPRISQHASSTERTFISAVKRNLMERYSTTAQATRAGYVAITGIETDGTAVYFNPRLTRVDRFHPNFLWYDKGGKLAGLDYEVPRYPTPPVGLFGASGERWTTVHEHVHFNYRIGSGPIRMGESRPRPNLRRNPITWAELRADHLLPANSTLVWAYHHPTNWDLGFWLVPNPNGAFANMNPKVRK